MRPTAKQVAFSILLAALWTSAGLIIRDLHASPACDKCRSAIFACKAQTWGVRLLYAAIGLSALTIFFVLVWMIIQRKNRRLLPTFILACLVTLQPLTLIAAGDLLIVDVALCPSSKHVFGHAITVGVIVHVLVLYLIVIRKSWTDWLINNKTGHQNIVEHLIQCDDVFDGADEFSVGGDRSDVVVYDTQNAVPNKGD